MLAKLRNFIVSVGGKLKAEFSFVLMIAVIIIAAIASFSYAYLRSDNQPTAAATISETQARQFEQFALSEPDTSVPAESPPSDPQTPNGNDNPAPQDNPKAPATLGEHINCAEINELAAHKLIDISKQPLTLDIQKLYKQIQNSHEAYSAEVIAKNCQPTLPLPSLDQVLRILKR